MNIQEQQICDYIGALAGILYGIEQRIQNIKIYNSNISSSYTAGFIASICSSLTIQMLMITDSSINCSYSVRSSSSWVVSGSIVGQILRQGSNQGSNQDIVKLQQCVIQKIQIYAYHKNWCSLSGGFIGDSHTTPLSITQSILNQSNISAYSQVNYVTSASGILSYSYGRWNCFFLFTM
ncbi:Hypothetical_protein [Hexamita inflata]|uniref:Hypothetical_protein n=1 Tax=Hexamita inflata TaxID=28002 RepID=A0ABP1HDU4_9EUKA